MPIDQEYTSTDLIEHILKRKGCRVLHRATQEGKVSAGEGWDLSFKVAVLDMKGTLVGQ